MLDICSYFFEGEHDDLFSFSDGPQDSGDMNSLQNSQMNSLTNAPTNSIQSTSMNSLQNTQNMNNSLQTASTNSLQNSTSGNTIQNSQNANTVQTAQNQASHPTPAASAPQKNFRSAWEYDGHDKNSYAYTPQNSSNVNLPKGNFTSVSALGGREVYSPTMRRG